MRASPFASRVITLPRDITPVWVSSAGKGKAQARVTSELALGAFAKLHLTLY